MVTGAPFGNCGFRIDDCRLGRRRFPATVVRWQRIRESARPTWEPNRPEFTFLNRTPSFLCRILHVSFHPRQSYPTRFTKMNRVGSQPRRRPYPSLQSQQPDSEFPSSSLLLFANLRRFFVHFTHHSCRSPRAVHLNEPRDIAATPPIRIDVSS